MKHDETPLVSVGTGTNKKLDSFSLVLSAMGIEHQIDAEAGSILVAEHDAEEALKQLNQYVRENISWPPPKTQELRSRHTGETITFFVFLTLALFYTVTGEWDSSNFWFQQGAVNRQAIILDHEWWRIVTALTLHADPVHLVGNCLIGFHIVLLLGRITGFGLCWALVTFAGALANSLNVVLREQQHLSVGFSTGIFAAIGLLAGLRMYSTQDLPIKQFLFPLAAGLGLLALLGSEGAKTDIGAHFFGFFCGIILGIIANRLDIIHKTASLNKQTTLFVAAGTLIFACWLSALRTLPMH